MCRIIPITWALSRAEWKNKALCGCGVMLSFSLRPSVRAAHSLDVFMADGVVVHCMVLPPYPRGACKCAVASCIRAGELLHCSRHQALFSIFTTAVVLQICICRCALSAGKVIF